MVYAMNNKQKEQLQKIFANPIHPNIVWYEVELMLKALGAEISEGKGSRVRIFLDGARAVFHRPHPQKEMDKGAVVSLRRFLIEAGIKI
jgi:hypothetical protein